MKIIFLDIDGPMIPATMYLIDKMASYNRLFPQTTVAALWELCKRTGAVVVFNTTHNVPFDGVPNIDVALMDAGFPEECLHPTDRHTAYPGIDRDLAVKEWLARHPEVNQWVALDDVRFSKDERVIYVEPMGGLSVAHVNEAISILGGESIVVLL